MFVYDVVGYGENDKVEECIRFKSVVSQDPSIRCFMLMQNDNRPSIRWVMYSYNPPFKVSLQYNDNDDEIVHDENKRIFYVNWNMNSDLFFQPTRTCELHPWLIQPPGSRTCWLHSVLNGFITSEYFVPLIQAIVDSRNNLHGGCLWLPKRNKNVAREAILKAFVNSRNPERSSYKESITRQLNPEIKALKRETRSYVSDLTDAPGIAQSYVTMILDFLDITYKEFRINQTYCTDIEGPISENVVIVKAPKQMFSVNNFVQYKYKGHLCERLDSEGFVLDHCVMRLSSNRKLMSAHYITGLKTCGKYFFINPTSNLLIPYEWTNLHNLPTPSLSDYLTKKFPIRAYAYLVYVRKPSSDGGANVASSSIASNIKPNIGHTKKGKPHNKKTAANKKKPPAAATGKVHTGPRGGKYVIRKGQKVYL